MMLAIVVATAMAVAPGGPAPVPGWTASRLSTSQPLLILAPRPGAGRAALVVRFQAGAVDDGELPGLTRVTQHVLLEGSRRIRFTDLLRQTIGADATLQLETGLADCTFTLEASSADFGRLSGIVLDLLLSPDPDPRAFATARLSAQHAEQESDGRDALAMIAAKVVDDPAFLNRPTGTEAGVELVELRDVRRHLAGPLSPANATVIFAGAFDPGAARRTVARHSGGRALPAKAPAITTPFSQQVPARKEIYLIAYRAPLRTPEQVAVARLAAALLEERVHWFFRDRGVGYSEAVDPIHRPWVDLFSVLLPARDPAGTPLGALLEEEIAAVREGRLAEGELERNRAWVLSSMERIDAEPLALARELADGNGAPWFGPDVVAALRQLDHAAFVRGAGALLAEEGSIRILYSPRAATRGAVPDAYRRPGGAR